MMQPDACVVRITDAEGNTKGTGFLVSTDGPIATCAHVVEGMEPHVTFPGGEPQAVQVVEIHEAHDVAFLRLTTPLPAGTVPAEFAPSVRREGEAVRAFGYPELGDIEGLWGVGQLVGRVIQAGRSLLQLSSTQITTGFSGGPVWDAATGRVIGMVVQIAQSDRYGKLEDVAFAISAETLRDLCPEKIELRYILPLGVPFQAPAVPCYFVPRPEVSNDVKAHLLAGEAEAPGALVVSAIHGLGGIGKTTLVAALAHDSELLVRFSDGILWATLGQKGDMLSLLVGWIHALGDYDFPPTVAENASAHLRTLLHDKACLLVVDDAWQADHLRPFLVGGERCRVLVTTRDATLARKVGARLYDLDVMTDIQALALFEARLGQIDGHREEAMTLARELGYLPLALELAATQVEAGVSWLEMLDIFRQAFADLAALDLDEAAYRNESLRLSFSLSLDGLPPDGRGGLLPNDLEAFNWLGILPEDVRLNPPMASILWDQPRMDAAKRLRHFRDKALLKQVGDASYRLHDLLHDEAKLRLASRMELRAAHATLLTRYRSRTSSGMWHSLPDDGYIHQHLTWHLEQAEWPETIHEVLSEETADGRNGWYQARERLGHVAGYLADVSRAWRISEQDARDQHRSSAIGLQCRYALINASLNSIAKNIHPTLLALLVEKDLWTPVQGLAYARQMPDRVQRAAAVKALAPHLSEALLEEALFTVRIVEDQGSRASSSAWLALQLAKLGFAEEALALSRAIEEEGPKAIAIARLAGHLPIPNRKDALREALSVAQTAWGWTRATTLAELISLLLPPSREQALAEALKAAREIALEELRVSALVALLPYLPPVTKKEVWQEALAGTRRVGKPETRVAILTAMIPHCTKSEKRQVLLETLAQIDAMEDEESQASALADLVPHLPSDSLETALAASRSGSAPWVWTKVIAVLAPYLSTEDREQVLEETLAKVWGIGNTIDRANALADLIPFLQTDSQEETLKKALATIRNLPQPYERITALTRLAPHLPEQSKKEALQAALADATEIRSDSTRAFALAQLAPHLPVGLEEEALQGALAASRAIRDADDRVLTLAALAPYLEAELLQAAWLAASALKWEKTQVSALAKLIPWLAAAERYELALSAMQTIGNLEWQSDVLSDLVSQLVDLGQPAMAVSAAELIKEEAIQTEVLRDLVSRLAESGRLELAMRSAQAIRAEVARAEALIQLIPQLSGELLEKALTHALAIENGPLRVEVLTEFSVYLPVRLKQKALEEALATARLIEGEGVRAQLLARLASYLSEEGRRDVLVEAAREVVSIQEESRRAEALITLGPYLSINLLNWALDRIRAMEAEGLQAGALAGLAPNLPIDLLEKAIEIALKIGARAGIRARSALALRLAEEECHAQALVLMRSIAPEWEQNRELLKLCMLQKELGCLQAAISTARAIKSKEEQAVALAGLAPQFAAEQRRQILREALYLAASIEQENSRALALLELIPHMPARLRVIAQNKALVAAQSIQEASNRASLLTEVIPHLPSSSRQHALESALAAALAIDWEETRVLALARLIPHLPSPLREDAIRHGRSAARTLKWQETRARALSTLALQLVEIGCPEEAIGEVKEIPGMEQRVRAFSMLALRLADLRYSYTAISAAQQIENPDERSVVLAEVACRCAKLGQSTEALAAVRSIEEQKGRLEALAEIAPYLPVDCMDKALEIASATQDADLLAYALASLSPHLPLELSETALVMARGMQWRETRVSALSGLAQPLSELPDAELHGLWQETLLILATRTRPDLLADLQVLVPIIVTLGGEEGVAETFRAIQDVGRWWP
jgi:hypothetical protein